MIHDAGVLLGALVADKPGIIVGPIAQVFGYIIDVIFNFITLFTERHSLGLAIILITVIVRFLMLPMGIKSQKSMIKMQKLNPEIEKIKAKYGNSKDPEIQQKINAETQALYSKNKVNPLSGCLPLLITMPLFLGLSYILNQSFLYVSKLGATYTELSVAVMDVPKYQDYVVPLAMPHVPQKMIDQKTLDISRVDDLNRILNKFSAADWQTLLNESPNDYSSFTLNTEHPPISAMPDHYAAITAVLGHKDSIENFFGLPLLESSDWAAWPGILIPVLVALTTFATSWIGARGNPNSDEKSKQMQKIMMYAMPVMMVFMTVGMPSGVGLYWITSSVFHVVQQAILNERAGIPTFKFKKRVEIEDAK